MDGYDDTTLSPASTSSQTTTMADSSCSHWWHGPFYILTSLTLAYLAFAATKRARPEIPTHSGHGPSLPASRALRAHGGFHITATLIQIAPELFFSGPESTVFAIHDSAISNLSAPPWAMRQLLRYHAAPSALPMAALTKKPPGFCFKTLADDKSLAVTGNGAGNGSVTINNVTITHPDLFLEGPFSVHGVSGPFDVDQPPPCDRNASYPSDVAVQWTWCIRLLSANGFVSFAVGLNSVVDGIIRDYNNLSGVSIFAPPNSGFISSSSPLLDKIVKIHILPQRFTYFELGAAENSTLRTLVPGCTLKIDKFSGNLAINGVEITRPDLYVSDKFAIHGISRELDDAVHFSSSFI